MNTNMYNHPAVQINIGTLIDRGAHIVGPSASILIQEFATPMRLGLTVDEMKNAIYTHPAASELVENAFLDA